MHNTASLLVLVFLAVTFIQSGYDKIFAWNDNVSWLKSHFEKTILKNQVPMALGIILLLEVLASVACLAGCVELLVNGGRTFGFYGAVISCITLIMLLLGQRLAKDYDGARTIAIYFIVAVLAVNWLG
ncbi:DoxX family protein [Flavobacterium croceum]|uniref:DoxX family protein n=1 Tax=Flavobacterium croceum TaxID=370975 RepID=UPI0024A810B6|nr:DoxX family protein [Flavobacterium croceum]